MSIGPGVTVVKAELDASNLEAFLTVGMRPSFDWDFAILDLWSWSFKWVSDRWVENLSKNWLVLGPVDFRNIELFYDFVITSLRGGVCLLVVDDQFGDPFGRSDRDVAGADKPDRVAVHLWDILSVLFVCEDDLISGV